MTALAGRHLVYASVVAVAVGCAYGSADDESGSSAATTFCDAFVASAKQCGQAGTTASCLTSAKHHSDAELSAATVCTEKPCAEVDACVDAVLGTSSTTPDGDAGADPSKRDAGTVTQKDAGDPPVASCKGFSSSPTCRACQEQQCCSQIANCRSNKGCSDFLDCCATMTCAKGDLTCLNSQCPFSPSSDFSAAVTRQLWIDCRAKKCASECPGDPYW